jgi:hypothetical protein
LCAWVGVDIWEEARNEEEQVSLVETREICKLFNAADSKLPAGMVVENLYTVACERAIDDACA